MNFSLFSLIRAIISCFIIFTLIDRKLIIRDIEQVQHFYTVSFFYWQDQHMRCCSALSSRQRMLLSMLSLCISVYFNRSNIRDDHLERPTSWPFRKNSFVQNNIFDSFFRKQNFAGRVSKTELAYIFRSTWLPMILPPRHVLNRHQRINCCLKRRTPRKHQLPSIPSGCPSMLYNDHVILSLWYKNFVFRGSKTEMGKRIFGVYVSNYVPCLGS